MNAPPFFPQVSVNDHLMAVTVQAKEDLAEGLETAKEAKNAEGS